MAIDTNTVVASLMTLAADSVEVGLCASQVVLADLSMAQKHAVRPSMIPHFPSPISVASLNTSVSDGFGPHLYSVLLSEGKCY